MHPLDRDLANKYSLYRESAIEEMESIDNFKNMLTLGSQHFSDRYYCRSILSNRKMTLIHDSYLEDIEKILEFDSDGDSVELDHFKYAATLCFCITKHKPISSIHHVPIKRYDEKETHPKREIKNLWNQFDNFGDEIVAFMFGFNICNSHHLQYLAATNPNFLNYVSSGVDHVELARTFEPNAVLLHDILKILKDDQLSIYAIYLIYRSMFESASIAPIDGIFKLENETNFSIVPSGRDRK